MRKVNKECANGKAAERGTRQNQTFAAWKLDFGGSTKPSTHGRYTPNPHHSLAGKHHAGVSRACRGRVTGVSSGQSGPSPAGGASPASTPLGSGRPQDAWGSAEIRFTASQTVCTASIGR